METFRSRLFEFLGSLPPGSRRAARRCIRSCHLHRLAELPVLPRGYEAFYYPPPYLVLCVPSGVPAVLSIAHRLPVCDGGGFRRHDHRILRTPWTLPAVLAFPAVCFEHYRRAERIPHCRNPRKRPHHPRPPPKAGWRDSRADGHQATSGACRADCIDHLTKVGCSDMRRVPPRLACSRFRTSSSAGRSGQHPRERAQLTCALGARARRISKMQSAFALARSLGAGVIPAYAVQGIVAAVSVVRLDLGATSTDFCLDGANPDRARLSAHHALPAALRPADCGRAARLDVPGVDGSRFSTLGRSWCCFWCSGCRSDSAMYGPMPFGLPDIAPVSGAYLAVAPRPRQAPSLPLTRRCAKRVPPA